MTLRYLLPVVLVLGAFGLSACDSGNASDASTPSDAATALFDQAIVDRANALDTSGPAEGLDTRYDREDRPLYAFASQADFEKAADALYKLAKWGGEPLVVPAQFESLDPADLFAPAAEMALLDENGRVQIHNTWHSLRVEDGEPVGSVADALASSPSEEFRSTLRSLSEMRRDPNARIKQGSEDEFGVYPSAPGNPSLPSANPFPVTDALGNRGNLWFAYAHSAYKTWTGAKRVKAATEVVFGEDFGLGNEETFYEGSTATRSQFPDLKVFATVLTEDYGCRTYSNDSVGNSRIEIEVGGSRGTGQGVIESAHGQVIDSQYGNDIDYTFSEYLDGENNSWTRKCGFLNPAR